MASNPTETEAASSRTSLSLSRNAAPSAAEPEASRRPDLVQLSAADCSVADDGATIPVSSSTAIDAAAQSAAVSTDDISSRQLPPPPPPFEPLFALLTNTTTGTTVHPKIHYIFSDDDDASIPMDAHGEDNNASGEQHRGLVVDLVPTAAHDGWAVSCASSLGPDFAVTTTDLSKQQSDGGNGGSEPSNPGGGGAGSLMLQIEGVSRDPIDLRSSEAIGSGSLPSSGSGSGAVGREDVETLADDFRRRMGVLKKVVGEGEKRRAVMAQQHLEAAAAATEHPDDGYQSHEIHDPGTLRSGAASQSQDATGSS